MLRRTTFLRAPIVVAALLTLLAACSGNDSSAGNATDSPASTSTASSSAHNNADVSFAKQMIPHHSQAIQMADMAINKSKNPAVLNLAKNIKAAQTPEIKTMTGWLKSWGQRVPRVGMGSMSGMSQGMPGMASVRGMSRMMQATDGEFDRMWLQMMTEHHKGAVKMAQQELRDGQSTDAKNLAQRIVDAQQAEITSMQGILDKLKP